MSRSRDKKKRDKKDHKKKDRSISRSRSKSQKKRKLKESKQERQQIQKDQRDSKVQNEEKQLKKVEFNINENKKQESEKNLQGLNVDIIESLKENPSYIADIIQERMQKQEQQQQQQQQQQNEQQPKKQDLGPISRTGGVYIPPHKLQQIQQEIMQSEYKGSREHQKLMFELLRKSINGIINKVNITNIQNVIIELLNENLIRGKGLLARAIIKNQMASPNFTHVYAALISVINTKLPDIVSLIIKRVTLQFQRAFKRNNKIVCMATTKMIAHLINQKVLSEFLGLELLTLLLENPTEDSVEIACDFMKECGQILSELTPAGANAIFDRFRGILQEGECDKRVQYSIENLFAIRKTKFKEHPGVIPELDLVEEEDIITHDISLEDQLDGEDLLNIFRLDPFFEKTEEEWEKIKLEILGEENVIKLKKHHSLEEEEEQEEEEDEQDKIQDLTEKNLVNLRRTIYLSIMNSIDFEECAHKIIRLGIIERHETEITNMIIECCMQERTYLRFYGLLAQRFSELYEIFRDNFMELFIEKYKTIHRYETNKLRNIAKIFAHLLYTDAIEWKVLSVIKVTQDDTTSSGRIFIKILFQELAENMGLEKLNAKLQDPDHQEYFTGLFPKTHPRHVRFSINFFTSIGLGALTEDLRIFLENMPKTLLAQQAQQMLSEEESSSSSDSDSETSSDSSSDTDSSSSDSSDSSD